MLFYILKKCRGEILKIKNFKLGIKCTIYYIAKLFGLFQLAIKLTENDFRILCYHSGSIHDEHLFCPSVFITPIILKKHLQLIEKYRFNVLPLDIVIKKTIQKDLSKRSLVLTFDDGFFSTKQIIEPILKKANYKATLYLTTYYVTHQRPIFNIALAYLFFKSEKKSFDITFLNGESRTFATKDNKAKNSLEVINEYAKGLDEHQQNQLINNIGLQLQVNMELIFDQRIFHNMNPSELKALDKGGVFDIQLHTHCHHLSDDDNSVEYEIQKNRRIISDIISKPEDTLVHFCYPSGIWNKKHLILLKTNGIVSATTLNPGLNTFDTDLLLLNRILCTNTKPLIIFEAEITGFNSLFMNSQKFMLLFKDCYCGMTNFFKYWFYKRWR